MTMLVTLPEAKAHLHVIHTSDDADITLKIEAASEAVLTYLKAETVPVTAEKAAKQATLLLLGEFYERREGEQEGEVGDAFGFGFLPRPVVALLYPHRDPSFS
jgi:hypothetical protein